MSTAPLTGFKHKAEQIAKAQDALKEAGAALKLAKDKGYDAKKALEQSDLMQTALGGPEACKKKVEEGTARLQELEQASAEGKLVGKANAALRQELKTLQNIRDSLGPLATKTKEECAEAAKKAVEDADAASKIADTANQTADELEKAAKEKMEAAEAIPDLDKAWEKDQTPEARSARSKEADLRTMKADLDSLGVKAPLGAANYCQALEKNIDHQAHHVKCQRCKNAEHGLERTDEAKQKVQALFKELDRLAAIKDPSDEFTALTQQQKTDRDMALVLQGLPSGSGKMIGIVICDDRTEIKGFSGDVAGKDDLPGWAQHIPPLDQGGMIETANKVSVPLSELPDVTGSTPHGVCAAPKMIQEAYRQGRKPVAMAEAWYGQGGVQPHGAFVASCATCCKNLDVQLCPNYPK